MIFHVWFQFTMGPQSSLATSFSSLTLKEEGEEGNEEEDKVTRAGKKKVITAAAVDRGTKVVLV